MRAILAEVQRGDCALCLTAGKFLELDHDHHTGLVRGMVCRSCNNHEGRCRWNGCERPVLAAYRVNPPAVDTGWIWDTAGTVSRIMLARARAAGDLGGISCIAPVELLGDAWTFDRHEW
jgi:Recombination endonuclease VII